MFEKIQLRHIYDWKVFIENELDKVDIEWFTSLKSKLSYGKFADILTAAVIKLYRLDHSVLPKQIIESVNKLDEKLVDRVIDYIFESDRNDKGKTLWAHRLDLVKRAFKDSWKYREIYDMSVMEMLWYRGKGIFKM